MTDRPAFVLPAGDATIVLDDGPYAGAEIDVITNVPYAVLRDVDDLFAEWRQAETRKDQQPIYERLCGLWAGECLAGWNLADRKGPIPADGDGMLRLPPSAAWAVMWEWRQAVGTVPLPLSSGSSSTDEPEPSTTNDSPDGDPSDTASSATATPSTPSMVA